LAVHDGVFGIVGKDGSTLGKPVGGNDPVGIEENPAVRTGYCGQVNYSIPVFGPNILMGYMTQFTVGFDGEKYVLKDGTMLMVIGALIVLSILSYVILLKRVGLTYDKGYNITYKD